MRGGRERGAKVSLARHHHHHHVLQYVEEPGGGERERRKRKSRFLRALPPPLLPPLLLSTPFRSVARERTAAKETAEEYYRGREENDYLPTLSFLMRHAYSILLSVGRAEGRGWVREREPGGREDGGGEADRCCAGGGERRKGGGGRGRKEGKQAHARGGKRPRKNEQLPRKGMKTGQVTSMDRSLHSKRRMT